MNKLGVPIGFLALVLASSGAEAAASATRLQKSFDKWRVDCAEEAKARRCALQYSPVNQWQQLQLKRSHDSCRRLLSWDVSE